MSNNILPFEYVENRKQNGLKFYLEKLSLKNFRNHVELDLHVNALPVLILSLIHISEPTRPY